MKRLIVAGLGICGGVTCLAPPAPAQNPPVTGTSQATTIRTPRPSEVSLIQALRANPATAPYPFATEPRGSKILLHGRVSARIVHDVAIRTAIALGVPVEDDITIDTGFFPRGQAGFGPVPGPGPTTTAGVGFGGPPSFGNSGMGPNGPGGGGPGPAGALVQSFPSAGSYGGAPSLLPPPLFGRYDDPFYGFDPPAVVYPPWWGGLNAQRVQANTAFNGTGGNGGGMAAPGSALPTASGTNAIPGQANNAIIQTPINLVPAGEANGTRTDTSSTNTDIGAIPDGTIDMEVDAAGVATIRGGIPSMAEKVAVGQRIAGMEGVTQVVNLLIIKPSLAKRNTPETPPPFPTPVEAKPPGEPRGNGGPAPILSQPVEPGEPPKASTLPPAINPTSDSGLTDRVSKSLVDRAATVGTTARVKVRDGVAYLSGKVASVFEAMLAYRAVQQVPGIRSVDDRLEFLVPDGSSGSNPLIEKGRPDDVEPYLEAQLRRQVGTIAHIDRVRIQVDSLTVRGTLSREEDRDRFDAILRSMPILRGFQIHADIPVATP